MKWPVVRVRTETNSAVERARTETNSAVSALALGHETAEAEAGDEAEGAEGLGVRDVAEGAQVV